ncbi:MAG: DUF2075 domain-containing protein [Eggerthellaceae bacterium]|nr:DUF2075 domain-containing protein [Eggerthellaceae bacterium]
MDNRSFLVLRGDDFGRPGWLDAAIGSLADSHVQVFGLEEPQLFAWKQELECLESIARVFPDCTVAFEYMIPRMGKRVDVVLLIGGYVFIVEFKAGEDCYTADATNQVADYAFDLKNFHKESHSLPVFPFLVSTNAPAVQNEVNEAEDLVFNVQLANSQTLLEVICETINHVDISVESIDHARWLNSVYSPTPTIIEAAQALYDGNQVEDISRNEAGLTNITETTECINKIIASSKANSRKSICFVTGVPGAGKTLVGLNLASQRREGETKRDEVAVFLSGNGPLIEVLQASLVEDQQRRDEEDRLRLKAQGIDASKKTKGRLYSEVKAFVQGVHLFREELFRSDDPPAEHIAIFDEAQRAWDESQLSYKMKTRWRNKLDVHKSEPECLIEYMDRHNDWAVIVCLVGGGQEIYKGEAGIGEWFKAIKRRFPDWDVYASTAIEAENYLGETKLQDVAPNAFIEDKLHLSVDMRSFRNKNVAAFAEALVSNHPEEARDIYQEISKDYPIYVTRDLDAAKNWVRKATKRPSDRYGVIAGSYAQRLRADGVNVPLDFDAVKWFLRGKDEIDSSYFMEVAASEFKIQGLEIDYAVVAWEGDFRYGDREFEYHRFYGGEWQNLHSDTQKRYLKNGYRVLLTRARQGYVIYVPQGSKDDPTRTPSNYDATYQYLLNAGIEELPEDIS